LSNAKLLVKLILMLEANI